VQQHETFSRKALTSPVSRSSSSPTRVKSFHVQIPEVPHGSRQRKYHLWDRLIYYNQIDISTCWYDAETESNKPKEKHSRTSDNVVIKNSKHNKNDLNDDAVSTSVVSVDKDQDKVQALLRYSRLSTGLPIWVGP
jgi:hypothetical protein